MPKPKINKRKPKKKSKKIFRELCSDDIDIFTQEELPKDMSQIAILNDKGPYHCVELEGFYQYWKSESDRGKDVKNPMTNQPVPKKLLNKIWLKIKKKHPKDLKPGKSDSEQEYMWIDGEQVEVRHGDNDPRIVEDVFELDLGENRRRRRSSVNAQDIRNALRRPSFMEPMGNQQEPEQSDFDSMDNRAYVDSDLDDLAESSDEESEEIVGDDDEEERNADRLPPLIRNNPIEDMSKEQLEEHKAKIERGLRRAHPRVHEAYRRRIRRVDRILEAL